LRSFTGFAEAADLQKSRTCQRMSRSWFSNRLGAQRASDTDLQKICTCCQRMSQLWFLYRLGAQKAFAAVHQSPLAAVHQSPFVAVHSVIDNSADKHHHQQYKKVEDSDLSILMHRALPTTLCICKLSNLLNSTVTVACPPLLLLLDASSRQPTSSE